MGVRGDGHVGGSNKQATGHAEVNDPLGVCLRVRICLRGCGLCVCGGIRRRDLAELADDVLTGAMNRQDYAAGKAFCLARARSFEGLRVRAEPRIDDAVEAQALIDTAGDGLHFG